MGGTSRELSKPWSCLLTRLGSAQRSRCLAAYGSGDSRITGCGHGIPGRGVIGLHARAADGGYICPNTAYHF